MISWCRLTLEVTVSLQASLGSRSLWAVSDDDIMMKTYSGGDCFIAGIPGEPFPVSSEWWWYHDIDLPWRWLFHCRHPWGAAPCEQWVMMTSWWKLTLEVTVSLQASLGSRFLWAVSDDDIMMKTYSRGNCFIAGIPGEPFPVSSEWWWYHDIDLPWRWLFHCRHPWGAAPCEQWVMMISWWKLTLEVTVSLQASLGSRSLWAVSDDDIMM